MVLLNKWFTKASVSANDTLPKLANTHQTIPQIFAHRQGYRVAEPFLTWKVGSPYNPCLCAARYFLQLTYTEFHPGTSLRPRSCNDHSQRRCWDTVAPFRKTRRGEYHCFSKNPGCPKVLKPARKHIQIIEDNVSGSLQPHFEKKETDVRSFWVKFVLFFCDGNPNGSCETHFLLVSTCMVYWFMANVASWYELVLFYSPPFLEKYPWNWLHPSPIFPGENSNHLSETTGGSSWSF